MKEIIRCGILGTGHGHAVGKLKVLQDSPDWDLAGVCEPDPNLRTRREREEAFANVRWLTESELLDDPELKMVAVEGAVPHLLDQADKVVDAGKHIHLDKPAGASLSQFKAILDRAEGQSLILQMGYMFRYNPGFDLVRKAVSESWLGEVHYLHGSINSNISPANRKPLAFHPGGFMFELSGHLVDILVLIMGRPHTVTPFLRKDGSFKDALVDNTLAVMEFDRSIAVIECGAIEMGASERRHFEVCGSRGSIILQPLEPPDVRLFLNEPHGGYKVGWQNVAIPNIPRYVLDLEELAQCIRGEKEFPYSKEHDFTMQETLLRACGVEDS